jgi:hypothetical protein
MSKVDEVLKKFGETAVAYVKQQLLKTNPKGVHGRMGNSVATGNLYNSIMYKLETNKAGQSVVYLLGADYLKNVVRGRGVGKRQPPIDIIVKWMMDKRLKPEKVSTGRMANRSLITYQKNQKMGKPKVKVKVLGTLENQNRSAAFLIARSIKKFGIKPIDLGIAGTGLSRNKAFDNESLTKALASAAKEDALLQIKSITKGI